jgi:hypothetical protein
MKFYFNADKCTCVDMYLALGLKVQRFNHAYTVKSCYLELEGTEKKVRDIRVFDISEVQYFRGFFK